jgi:hypothetical protein
MVKFTEVETKYHADNMHLKDFKKFAKSLNPIKYIEASGFDYYFTKNKSFTRYRAGDLHELTKKRQTDKANNYIRTEINMRIVPEDTEEKTLEKVTAFVAEDGYKFNFSIFKSCFIYFYPSFDLVYYIIFDSNMKEQGRFFEIEMLEDYPWESLEQVWEDLLKIEKQLAPLGIKPSNRINKSLFQMFKK